MESRLLKIIFCFFFCFISVVQYSQIISTYAGNNIAGYSGDLGPAISAKLYDPVGVAADNSNNLYIADYFNQVIRKVNYSSGIITSVVGSGVQGYSGDGGLATSAKLSNPYAVAIDNSGNLYIADRDNNRIRKVIASTGIINTIAGTGTMGYSGDGGLSISADLNWPDYIALDASGNIYFSQSQDHVVRKINVVSGIITTVAGNGLAGFSGDGSLATSAQLNKPLDIVLDGSSNLYIADSGNHRVRKVNSSNGIITTIAGTGNTPFSGDGGLAINANLYSPWGLGVDVFGNIYIVGTYHQRVRKVDVSSGVINTIAGSCTTSCIPYGNYSGDGGLATLAELSVPTDACFDSFGNMYIADSHNYCIRKVTNVVNIGITEIQNNNKVNVYPNPVSTELNISASQNDFKNGEIEITNCLGQIVFKIKFKNEIDVSDLSSGCYTLKITSSNKQQYYSKFIKE